MDHQALLEKFFEFCPNGLCLCSVRRSAAGAIEEALPVAVNEAFCVHAGQPAAELIGRPLHLILRNFYLLTQKYFASLHDLGQSFTLELQLEPVHKPVTVTVFFLDEDHMMVILQDATEHQVAEAALLSIGEMWAFSLEGEGDGVWDWEIPQKTIHYSRRFKEILGISDELSDVDDFDFKDRIHPEEVERVSQSIHEHVKGLTNNYVQEHRMRSDEGSYKWVITRGKVIKRTTDGRALRMIGTLTDTSERRMITEALQRSQKHPEHIKVFDFVVNACESRIVVDYFSETPGP
jgi:PAS domain S-box-containing protein